MTTIRFAGLELRFLQDGHGTNGSLDLFTTSVQPNAESNFPRVAAVAAMFDIAGMSTALRASLAFLPLLIAGGLGSVVTRNAITDWYQAIPKPSWTPPNWLFGPAWTLLYLMMAYAFFRVLGLPRETPGWTFAVVVFLLHVCLNALWSFAFFGARSPSLGLAELAVFWPVAALNVVAFAYVDRIAGLLMLPNIAWVSFAALLNFEIWRLNR